MYYHKQHLYKLSLAVSKEAKTQLQKYFTCNIISSDIFTGIQISAKNLLSLILKNIHDLNSSYEIIKVVNYTNDIMVVEELKIYSFASF